MATPEITDYIRTNYPQLAWILTNPEVGPLIEQAASEKWDVAKLQGALLSTNWWKSTSAAQREFARLQAEDPASAQRRMDEAGQTIRDTASRLGVQLSTYDIQVMSQWSAAEQWDSGRLAHEILGRASAFNPQGSGDVNAVVSQVKARAAQFLMPLGDDAAFGWAKNILTGAASKDGLDAYLRNQALNRFAGDTTITSALQNGATPKDIFDPYVQQTASLLEMSPAEINLLDPQWSSMIDGQRADGKQRPMSLSEAGQYVRGLDQWKGTQQAGQQASAFGEQILRTFGKVAG